MEGDQEVLISNKMVSGYVQGLHLYRDLKEVGEGHEHGFS